MFTNNNSYTSEQEENGSTPERAGESPSTMFNDIKMSSTSSPKRSRRAVKKRVVSIPIKDVDGSRAKGESAPPSDSWAWRKYGQKPIKGSPYPRGYYRCSSSKGCPARKQVERSRMDPTTLLITYSSEHNHPWPASRNHHNHHSSTTAAAAISDPKSGSDNYQISPNSEDLKPEPEPEPEPELIQEEQEDRFADLAEEPLITGEQFRWFGDMDTMTPAVLESPVFADDRSGGAGGEEVAMFFPMREEDESLFADLGELPECSVVFRRGALEREEERRRCTAGPWCGTTG